MGPSSTQTKIFTVIEQPCVPTFIPFTYNGGGTVKKNKHGAVLLDLMRHLLRNATNTLNLRKVVKRLELCILIEEYPALNKVRQGVA